MDRNIDMAVFTYRKDFADLPNETILNVFSYLDKSDLAEVRHSCKRLASLSAKPLFKSITTSVVHLRSLLWLACHRELSNYVEELVFLEMNLSYIRGDVTSPLLERKEYLWELELVSLVRQHFGFYPDFDDNTSKGDEDLDLSTYEMNDPFHYGIDGLQGQVFSEVFSDSWKPNTAARAMLFLLVDTTEHYKQLQKFGESEEAYQMLKTSLGGLPNLRRIKICDAHQGGILKPFSYLPPSLIELQQYVPLDEAVLTRFSHHGPGAVSSKALRNLLAAVAESKKPIDSLVVFHNTGLFESGILLRQAPVPEYHLQTDQDHWKGGLSHVRSLEISLDICHGASDEAEQNKNNAQTSLLSVCLRLSTTNLESLSISFAQNVQVSERQIAANKGFFHVIPLDCVFTKLHTLTLQWFVFESGPVLTNFLVQQPALRNLDLISCEVIGTWCSVLDRLQAASNFMLDTINLQKPRDTDDHDRETANGRSIMTFLSSRIPNAHILYYINSKGTLNMTNPFAKLQRQWRAEDAAIWNASVDAATTTHIAQSELLEDLEFEDASDWDYEERMHSVRDWSRRQAEDADEEGPEFDSDYDFDAEEESDSDDEGVIWGQNE